MKLYPKIDLWLMAPVTVILMLSLTTLYSLDPQFFKNQLISLLVAIIIFLIFNHVNISLLKHFKTPFYIISILLLLMIIFVGIESRGASRWIIIFGMSIQISEIIKPFTSIAFAAYLAGLQKINFRSLVSIILLFCPVFALIYFQPDLGSAMVFGFVLLLILLVYGYPYRWFLILLIPILLFSPLIWGILHDYQRDRILSFIEPQKDPQGISYNSIQSVIAVGSGMLFGKGFGEGTQSGLKFLPERHTDFIFAAISEGLGFMGCLILILTFGLLLFRLYIIFAREKQIFEKTIIASCFFFILIQFLFNVGMNIGILPIVGITLPFASYGGSSLVSNFIFLGIVSAISKNRQKHDVLEIR